MRVLIVKDGVQITVDDTAAGGTRIETVAGDDHGGTVTSRIELPSGSEGVVGNLLGLIDEERRRR